ncbi:MAG: restriction endonuclease subunit S [Bacteroidetes bacterium]|nr:restriction endonuclease subunit S [Bacteroidota bacterium]
MNRNKKAVLEFISYSSFEKWYVSYYLNPYRITSKYPLISLDNLIEPIQIRVKKDDYDGLSPIVGKISFKDGKIHLRDENKTGMDLYVLPINELLVSKINFHQGAVAINNNGKLVCSTHYQPYKIDNNKINRNYLILVLRSNGFLNFIKYLRADGIKNEATYEFIGQLNIPFPKLEEQTRIVKSYYDRVQLAERQEMNANKIEKNIETYLFDALGIKKLQKGKNKKGLQIVNSRNVERWAVDFLNKVAVISEILRGKYKIVKLRDFIDSYQYGLSEKSSIDKIGPPMLRMNNILNSELDITILKYISINDNVKDKYTLDKGDLLFNRTNSKELVGKTAIFYEDEEYTFASYLIRVVVNTEKANVNYINYLFNSSLLKYQKDMVSRQITGQANINAQEMQEFLFPLPPLQTQKEIANILDKMRDEMNSLRQHAKENRTLAIEEFEKEIFK